LPSPPVRDTASYRAPALEPASEPPLALADLDTGETAVEEPPRTLVDTPGPEGESPPPPATDLVAADRWSDLGRRSSRPPPARKSAPPLHDGPRRPLPPRPPSVPPDASAPLTAIRAAASRDEVVAAACEAATTIARAAVFLALKGGMWKGIDGVGGRVSRDAIRNLFLPVGSASMFKRVVEEVAPYHGRYGTTAADNLFRAAIGSRGGELIIQPIVIGERVVAVLCADDVGYGEVGARRLEAIAHAVAEAFKRLIVHGKSIPP
jgi:hypothetical protein